MVSRPWRILYRAAIIVATTLAFGRCGQDQSCTPGWYVTGYYTPVEGDFTGPSETITVDAQAYEFTTAFLEAIKIEGWGKTKLDTYLGYDGRWYFASEPQDKEGNVLALGTVAVDPTVVKFDTIITIPGLPLVLGVTQFVAHDVGVAIKKKHIDVYTGEGQKAFKNTYAITGTYDVCLGAEA